MTPDIAIEKNTTEDVIFPSGDLWSDEPPLESDWHRKQIEALIDSAERWLQNRQDFYVSGNLTIYYSPNQLKSEDFRGPDFFAVLGVDRKERKSWVVWQEDGRYPNVIIEILSDSTAGIDRGLKRQIYQDIFRTPEYFWFDPQTSEFKGLQLVGGRYQELQANATGWLFCQQLGVYLGIHDGKLRLFNPEGQLIPISQELAEQEHQRAEQEQQQKTELQQQLTDAEALLARYQERFGQLPEQ
ncbi:MAG: Uma2 family endonuclease [Cyanosarcina radialis HA8281-LM2]|nr:Uma2 family endonuclease [Cyanosarcina radialis HA8281-LM2]